MTGYLHLEDGTILEGVLSGNQKAVSGEVVFSTGMTGYPESMTDPSFANQILTFTYPIIGSYGVPKMLKRQPFLMQNFESEQIWVKAIVVSTLIHTPSHYQNVQTLDDWCKKEGIPILSRIDTRALTQKLREHGTMRGQISLTAKKITWSKKHETFDYTRVSLNHVETYQPIQRNGKKLALIDCGVKHGILRSLLDIGYEITRVPWDKNPLDIAEKFDGVVVSNGPGDPKDWKKTVENIKKILENKIPFVGVCLGHQLCALAIGADTYKLKYGHRGINQPCQDILTKKCYLTSQNHGYAVKADTITQGFLPWFINLNDGTNEGMINEKAKIWTSQFHPEGNPGPYDSEFIFRKFLD